MAKFLEVEYVGEEIHFALGNGTKIVFDRTQCSTGICESAMRHGFNQKIRDSASSFSKTENFSGAAAAMRDVIESLYAGEWNRKGGNGSGQRMEDLATAISRIKKVPFEKALAVVQKADDAKRKEWGGNAKIKAIVASLVAERAKAAAKADSEDLEIEID